MNADTIIQDAEFSVRAENVISRLGNVKTLGDLSRCTYRDISMLKNCGNRTIAEIRAVLSCAGLSLAGEKEPEPAWPQEFEGFWIHRTSATQFHISDSSDPASLPIFVALACDVVNPCRLILLYIAGIKQGRDQLRAEMRRAFGIDK